MTTFDIDKRVRYLLEEAGLKEAEGSNAGFTITSAREGSVVVRYHNAQLDLGEDILSVLGRILKAGLPFVKIHKQHPRDCYAGGLHAHVWADEETAPFTSNRRVRD